MKDRARLEALDHCGRGLDAHEHGNAAIEAVDHLSVGRVYPVGGGAQQFAQHGHCLRITVGRDAPVNPYRRRALVAHGLLEPLKPDVDDRDPFGQFHDAHPLRLSRTS